MRAPPFAQAAKQAAAGVLHIKPTRITIELDDSTQIVCVRWSESMTVGAATWKKVEVAVENVLPEKYKQYRVSVM